MPDEDSRSAFWSSVALKLIAIWLIGWASVLWFRGCLMPAARDDLRDQQHKAAEPNLPHDAPVQPPRR